MRTHLSLSLIAGLALLISACDGAGPIGPETTLDGAAAKADKVLVCHVGNETGPNGETYDPACVPSADNEAFCPDAGKIDLISVSPNALKGHRLACDPEEAVQPKGCHCFGGVCDFDPTIVEGLDPWAEGAGEDADGDGIDDGCDACPTKAGDLPDGCPPCPCWNESELLQVTAETQRDGRLCASWEALTGVYYPDGALIQDDTEGILDGVEGGFAAYQAGFARQGGFPDYEGSEPACFTRDLAPIERKISAATAATCIQQIADRCAAIGDPIVQAGAAPSKTNGAPASPKKPWGE